MQVAICIMFIFSLKFSKSLHKFESVNINVLNYLFTSKDSCQITSVVGKSLHLDSVSQIDCRLDLYLEPVLPVDVNLPTKIERILFSMVQLCVLMLSVLNDRKV